jgi:hypothetical protein
MITVIVPATATTNIHNAPCLARLLSRSVFIITEASGFARHLKPSAGRSPPFRLVGLSSVAYASGIHGGTQHEAIQSRLAHSMWARRPHRASNSLHNQPLPSFGQNTRSHYINIPAMTGATSASPKTVRTNLESKAQLSRSAA